MYIVSPNCDMSKLPQAAAQWARQFPLAPALPNFLAELSVAPRPYKIHCPSKAHRPVFMTMLAWLMRGGWVTQLCTFAYVVVWPEIIYEVEYALEAEELVRAKTLQAQGADPASVESDATVTSSAAAALGETSLAGFGFLPLTESLASLDGGLAPSSSTVTLRDLSISTLSLSHTQPLGGNGDDSSGSENTSPVSSFRPDVFSPTMYQSGSSSGAPYHRSHHHAEPTAAEKAAENARLARIAEKASRDLADRALAHARRAPPKQTKHPSVNTAFHLATIAPHVILDAKKATGKESLYLKAIERRLREGAERRKDANKDGTEESNGGGGKNAPPKTNASIEKDRQAAAAGAARVGTTAGSILGPGPKREKDGSGGGAKNNGTEAAASGLLDKEWAERVAKAWPLFWKYFNGRSALERIALQEDMKRKDVWNLLTSMSEYMLSVRTW
jgi:hypothetical protein